MPKKIAQPRRRKIKKKKTKKGTKPRTTVLLFSLLDIFPFDRRTLRTSKLGYLVKTIS
jgi:hypothetical protein